MNTITTENVALNDTQEVLAHCLLKSHAAYLGLVEEGISSDVEELGKTVRRLARCLTEVTLPLDSFDDGDDPEREEVIDEQEPEITFGTRLKVIQ